MNKDIKKLWVLGMTGGSYAGGNQAVLCQKDTQGDYYHSCLGVLARVVPQYQGHWTERGTPGLVTFGFEVINLPEQFRTCVGLTLKQMNAVKQLQQSHSFEYMAQWVEKSL